MTKVSKNTFILLGVAAVFVIVGIFIFTQQKDDPADNQPIAGNCKTFGSKKYCADKYIGLKENEAISKAKAEGLATRVVATDDNRDIATHDNILSERINFTIEKGLVSKAEFY